MAFSLEQSIYAEEVDKETVAEVSILSEEEIDEPITEDCDSLSVEKEPALKIEEEVDAVVPSEEVVQNGPVSWIPSGVDLRDQGLVTPVKHQAPWGTCWAFSTVSAMETSVLGLENTTAQEAGLDFSERYLIVFGLSPITETTDPNQAGEGLYLLNDQSSHPEDGTLLSAFSAQPEYAGYHRVNLPESVHLEKGSKFSIVTTIREISEDGTLIYKYSVNMASNLEESQELGFPIYGKAVVNAGESFLYKNGSWSDWTEYRTTDEFKELYSENEHVYGEIDNFTIKAYLLPDETVEPDTVPAVNTEIPVSQTETYAAQTVQTGVHNETGLWIIILFGSIICIYRLRKEA